MKNYYDILQVSPNASQDIIDKVYKILAKRYHPDLNWDNYELALQNMTLINEAYEVLGDKVKRDRYDKNLAYEKNKVFYENYKPYEGYKETSNLLNSMESFIIKALLSITGIAILLFFVYIISLPISKSIQSMNSKKDVLNTKQRVYIYNLPTARSQGYWKNGVGKSKLEYILGQEYKNNLVQEMKIWGLRSGVKADTSRRIFCSADYILNGKYSTLNGYVGISDDTKNSQLKGRVVVLADSAEIFRSDELVGGYEAQRINLNIEGANRLQIRFEAEPGDIDGWYINDNIEIGLFDGVLNR